ncbi:MAG: hypothetical protein MJ175_05075 [Clostridia bacterium]|nr:hypothetical protein [Clostridia bacterium]
MNTTLTIADVTFTLVTESPLTPNEPFDPFYSQSSADEEIIFVPTDILPMPEHSGLPLHTEMGIRFEKDNSGAIIRCHYPLSAPEQIYAVSRIENGRTVVRYLPEAAHRLKSIQNVFSHIGFENLLLAHDRIILHACCVETAFGGLLFSGPSGIGKSTQGDLWCRSQNAVLLNGDRPILAKNGTSWTAYGSPYAGSSHCHRSASVWVRAIVMLRQAKICRIRRLSQGEAFRNLYPQMTVNSWDPTCVDKVSALTVDLAKDIPVYELACTPDMDAVALLSQTLQKEMP